MPVSIQGADGLKTFRLPSSESLFTSYFDRPLVLREESDKADLQCAQWVDSAFETRSATRLSTLYSIHNYTWASLCFPTCDEERLRPIADYFTYILCADDITDKMSKSALKIFAKSLLQSHHSLDTFALSQHTSQETGLLKLTRDFWMRFSDYASDSIQRRFLLQTARWFECIATQADDRDNSAILDFDSMTISRRIESGMSIVLLLTECVRNIEMQRYVLDHPVINALHETSTDLLIWANDIYSYNVEQARGDDNHNMIKVLMVHHGLSLQDAVDHLAEQCRRKAELFQETLKNVPSFGDDKVDHDVASYVEGIKDVICATVHWYLITERYGKDIRGMRDGGIVRLLPKDAEDKRV